MDKKNKELSQEQIITLSLVAQGRKLGALLASSKMPQDIKDAWVAILPEMTLPQIEIFSNILEAGYIDSQTKDIDKKFKSKIEKQLNEFQKKENGLEKKIQKEATKLKKMLIKSQKK